MDTWLISSCMRQNKSVSLRHLGWLGSKERRSWMSIAPTTRWRCSPRKMAWPEIIFRTKEPQLLNINDHVNSFSNPKNYEFLKAGSKTMKAKRKTSQQKTQSPRRLSVKFCLIIFPPAQRLPAAWTPTICPWMRVDRWASFCCVDGLQHTLQAKNHHFSRE